MYLHYPQYMEGVALLIKNNGRKQEIQTQEKEGDLLPVRQTEAMPSAGLNNGRKLLEV